MTSGATQGGAHLTNRLHHGAEAGSTKRRVGEFLESTKVEILILCLVVCDIVLLGVEHGIDRHIICIEGRVAPLAPDPLFDLAVAHGEPHGGFFLQALAGPPGAYAEPAFLSLPGGSSEAHGIRRASHTSHVGDLGADSHSLADALVAESGLLSPLALIQDAKVGVRSQKSAGAASHQDHPEHGHEEHGHEEHGHDEHGGIIESGHEEDGDHDAHGHGGHGHHHANEALVCETRNGPNAHAIHHNCHMLSIAILVIFLVEILAKIWVNPPEFFGNPWEVLDLVVVVLSLVVDVIIVPMLHDPEHKHDAETVIIVLMVLRFWRVVRIFHGIFEVVHHQIEDVRELNERIEELEKEIAERKGEMKPESKV